MDFGFAAEDQAFRSEVSSFLSREVTAEVVAEVEGGQGPGTATKALNRKLGRKGWLTLTWPLRYGGLEGSHIRRLIVDEERAYHRAYAIMEPLVGPTMAGPTILMFGTEEQKREYLPRIAAGEIDFALGYTEPGAGSDLAAMQMRAIDDGPEFVVTGQKLFNTGVHHSQYHWLGVRSEPDAPRHKGISLLIVDLSSPGITIQPLHAINGMRTNVVYYDEVRVPKANLVGGRGRGFYCIATALDFERIFPVTDLKRALDDLIGHLRATDPHALDNALVRQRLAQMATEVEASRLLSYRIAWLLDQGKVPNYEASMLKLYVSESAQRFAQAGASVMGHMSELQRGSDRAEMDGRWSQAVLDSYLRPIVGGTSEIQRNIIATRGLELPRE